MGLFEEAGRQFERFKKQVESAAEETANYRCVSCETALEESRDRCPECGADDVVPVERADDPTDEA